ncbi:MAG: hypothetical protein CM15mP126_7930 [Gammaproteobacteria bacterium]|nr:MAG: hypothetical protein CM15mP126_7930 [Gammaproteobacteria bacterium]
MRKNNRPFKFACPWTASIPQIIGIAISTSSSSIDALKYLSAISSQDFVSAYGKGPGAEFPPLRTEPSLYFLTSSGVT